VDGFNSFLSFCPLRWALPTRWEPTVTVMMAPALVELAQDAGGV
jgi:hypothetical protein